MAYGVVCTLDAFLTQECPVKNVDEGLGLVHTDVTANAFRLSGHTAHRT
jgi:hypothetical protein